MRDNQYKIGDIVFFEECWEDESGQYHDESAEILAINEDGSLELKWLVEHESVREFLDAQEYTTDQIVYPRPHLVADKKKEAGL